MKLPVETHHLPLRLATGAFILSSGLDKYGADEETAQGLHSTAKETYPFLDKVAPAKFTQCLSLSEIALGSALILPIVPSRVAGAGLSAFACALLGMYLRAPGMRRPNSLRPTPDGIAMAKDSWLLGAGLTLMLDRQNRRAGRCGTRRRR